MMRPWCFSLPWCQYFRFFHAKENYRPTGRMLRVTSRKFFGSEVWEKITMQKYVVRITWILLWFCCYWYSVPAYIGWAVWCSVISSNQLLFWAKLTYHVTFAHFLSPTVYRKELTVRFQSSKNTVICQEAYEKQLSGRFPLCKSCGKKVICPALHLTGASDWT